jgi:hypothetical protein
MRAIFKNRWRLIQNIYKVNPLTYPKRVIRDVGAEVRGQGTKGKEERAKSIEEIA